MNAVFNDRVHCVAAEPLAVFVRVSLVDAGQEIAYESAVLGRLRGGCRVFQLRSVLGTRIELCILFVRVSFGSETNLFSTPRQVCVVRLFSHLISLHVALPFVCALRL